jgi:predicted glycosyltransferase
LRIWVDCTAAAHPLVLRPIIDRLEAIGHEVDVTAREYGQTVGILERLRIPHTVVGEHGGASRAGKARALASRSRLLAKRAWDRRYELAIAHGSVDLAVVAGLFRIPSAQMQDYEFAGLQRKISFRVARRVLVPDAIPLDRLKKIGAREQKLVRYPGLKEDYYLADFRPDPAVLEELAIDRQRILVVVRPPPETSEYHAENPLYEGVIGRLAGEDGAIAVVIPRTERQGLAIEAMSSPNLIVPERAIDAQSLIAYADLVVSAGGTMNREAVALGTPVYTTFSGREGAVDERLIAEGLLRRLESPEALVLEKRSTEAGPRNPRDVGVLVDGILSALPAEYG